MVQLKVCINGTYKEFDLISIPHGTIKSMIPEISRLFRNAFQYLMVQLKD